MRLYFNANASFNCVRHFILHKIGDLKPHSVQDALQFSTNRFFCLFILSKN